MPTTEIFTRPTTRRDLKRIGPGPERKRIRDALERLRLGDPSLDIKPLTEAPPWMRLRVGDYRICYRSAPPPEGFDMAWVVDRIVHRRDLDAAVASLPAE